jgi:phosphohistidine phosphatase
MDLSFDHIFSSPFKRAKQTAEIVVELIQPDHRIEYSVNLQPEGDREVFVSELITKCTAADRVLLVGHEPHLSGLVSFLVCGDDSMEMRLRKGGLCKLSVSSLRVGKCAVLEWLLTRKQAEAMR